MATRTRSRRSPARTSRAVSEALGPFVGVFDTDEPNGADWRQYLNYAVNVWVPPGGTGTEPRPAFNTELLTANANPCRGIYMFAKSDGTKFPIGIFGQKVYRLDTGSDFTPTVTIIAAGNWMVYATMFNDEMIFNDGVNIPFRWNGVSGSAGTTINFNVGTGVAYGAPWVYLAKLFFIRADARLQFVWSEENQAGVGYQQVNFANFWNFQQSSTEPLCGGEGTNDGMYIFRARSVAYVTGAVSANFSTTGTFDGVSDHIGCPHPSCKIRVAQTVYFLDMFGRLHAAGPDPNVRALYDPARIETSRWSYPLGDGTVASNALTPAFLIYWNDADLLLHSIPVLNVGDVPAYALAWQRTTEKYMGIWQDGATVGFNYGLLTTSASNGIRMMGVGSYQSGSPNGLALYRADGANNCDMAQIVAGIGGNGLYDAPGGVHSAVVTVEQTGPILNDASVSKMIERIVWIGEVGAPNTGTGFSLQNRWLTNLGSGKAFARLPTVPAASTSTSTYEVARVAYGPAAAQGRYLRYKWLGGYDAQNGNIQGWHKTTGVLVSGTVELEDYTQDTPTVNSYGNF